MGTTRYSYTVFIQVFASLIAMSIKIHLKKKGILLNLCDKTVNWSDH